MKIPIPCNFGNKGVCNNKYLIFSGVTWFKWSTGYDYTYFFHTENKWSQYDFYTSKGEENKNYIDIKETLLEDKSLVEHGYPLTGTGYLSGISYKDGKYYADLIITSHYLSHIKVECDTQGIYQEGGVIIFPPTPSFDTTEKRQKYLLKKYHYLAETK